MKRLYCLRHHLLSILNCLSMRQYDTEYDSMRICQAFSESILTFEMVEKEIWAVTSLK